MNILIRDVLAILPDGPKISSVFIQNGIIASIDIPPEGFIAEKTIQGSGYLLIPGLINAHTHVSMTIFRNYADDLMFNDWLFGKILPLEDKLTAEDCYWGAMLGIMEMLKTGTTSFIDMYVYLDEIARAVHETGIRAVLSRGLTGGDDNKTDRDCKLREAINEISRAQKFENISYMFAPHAPYTCDEGYQREIASEANRLGLGINTHLSESLAEIETIRGRYGCTPIELADKTGLLTERTVAAHCVHLTENDINLLAARRVTVATNPVSNLKLGNGVAPVLQLLKAGVNIALGTDGAASNNALNMFRDLSFVTLIHKGVNGNAQAVSASEGLQFATVNGAKAMGLAGQIGEIKPGMKADLVMIDLDHPNMQPLNDPIAALSYSACGSEVDTVIVGGKVLLEKRIFTQIDCDRVPFEIEKICKRIGMR